MSMQNTIFQTVASAMTAENKRTELAAENLTHAHEVFSDPSQVYRQKAPVFETLMDENGSSSGVHVYDVVALNKQAIPEYQPYHPLADANGYIYKPDISPIDTLSEMLDASKTYQMGVEVLNSSKTMLLKTIQILEG